MNVNVHWTTEHQIMSGFVAVIEEIRQKMDREFEQLRAKLRAQVQKSERGGRALSKSSVFWNSIRNGVDFQKAKSSQEIESTQNSSPQKRQSAGDVTSLRTLWRVLEVTQ
jgi:hypothetical protein